MQPVRDVPTFPEAGPPEAHVAMVQIARILIGRGCRSVGLLGAAGAPAIPEVGLWLGRALMEVAGEPVVVVVERCPRPGPAASDPDGQGRPTGAAEDLGPLLTVRTLDAGQGLHALEATLREEASATRRLLLDLTGFVRSGEYLEAIAMLDGTAIVALAGRTRIPQVERWAREIQPDRSLGVLLLDPR